MNEVNEDVDEDVVMGWHGLGDWTASARVCLAGILMVFCGIKCMVLAFRGVVYHGSESAEFSFVKVMVAS